MRHRLLVILCVVAVLFSGVLFAQETTGELNGRVLLEDGAALPGVTVTATGTNLVGKKVTISDETGAYRLPMLPPGTYKLTFTLEGFKTVIRDKIILEVGKVLKLDIALQTGALEETVEVSGSTPLVDVRQSSTSSNITKETFSKLPKGRNFSSVMSNQAGVNKEGKGYYFNGGSLSENSFFVDGTNTTSMTTGLSGQRVDTDSVEEVQVKSAGYSAEYGGSMGGVISVITKSGGNEFHGDLSFYYNADWLTKKAKAPIDLVPNDPTKMIYDDGRLKDKYQRLEPSLSLGGFIIKDKVWFFTNFAPSFSKTTRKGRFVNKSDMQHNGEEFESKKTRYKGSAKITAALTNNIRFNIGGTLDWQKNEHLLPALDGKSKYDPKAWDEYGHKWPSVTVSGGLDWTIGNNAFLSLTGGYYRTNSYDAGNKPEPPIRILFENSNAHLNPGADLVRNQYWYNISWDALQANKKSINTRTQAKADFTYYLNAGGEHVLKAGFSWSRQKLDVQSGIANEYWRFYWRDDTKKEPLYDVFEAVTGEKFPTTYGYVRTFQYGELGETHNDIYTFYAQDSWTIGGNFTLNFGIRAEKEAMPTFSDEFTTAFKFDFGDKIAPRVGFAWDINGDGKNKVFGSFGIYYDVMKLNMALGTFGGTTFWRGYYDVVTLDWKKYLTVQGPTWDKSIGTHDPILGGKQFEYMNLREVSDPSKEVQPDMKPFSKMEISLGYSRMLADKISFTVTGIYNKVLNAIEDIGIQYAGGEKYFVGNPGSDWIREQFKPGVNPDVPDGYEAPEAIRKYRSVKFELEKKWADNWFGGVSLTWSRLTGNFSGLGSSDEGHRTDPMVNRFFDVWFMHLKQDLTSSDGVLPTDRPIDVRLYGAYTFNFDLTVGFNAYIKSGTPVTRYVDVNGNQGYCPVGRGTEGRTPTTWGVDLNIEQKVKITDRIRLSVSLNIFNATNNSTATKVWGWQTYEKVGISNDIIKAGYNIDEVLKNSSVNLDPRYLKEYSFQSPISAQLGFKLSF